MKKSILLAIVFLLSLSAAANAPKRYKLSMVSLDIHGTSNLYYTADGIYLVTELCLELPVAEDATLVWYGQDDLRNKVEWKNGKTCQVEKLLREFTPQP
jgi:hypothetical protein